MNEMQAHARDRHAPGVSTCEACDVVGRSGCLDPRDRERFDRGHHYDYRAQVWRDGHDHAHYLTDRGPLFFCGADAATCVGSEGAALIA